MAESLKDKIVDKAVEAVLELCLNVSAEELKSRIDSNKFQRVLYKVIGDFSKSSYFHREFQSVLFVENRDAVFSIADDDINPAKTVEDIYNVIFGLIENCFVTDRVDALQPICQYISSLYLQRSKMMMQIYHIFPELKGNFEEISNELSELKQLIVDNYAKELRMRHEQEVILKKELHNEVTNIVCEMLNKYLYLVIKTSPTYEGDISKDPAGNMAGKTQEILNEVDAYVKEDFFSVPVTLTIANGFTIETKTMPYLFYSEHVFRKCILNSSSKLMEYRDIIDQESYLAILRLRNEVQGNFFIPVDELGQGAA